MTTKSAAFKGVDIQTFWEGGEAHMGGLNTLSGDLITP